MKNESDTQSGNPCKRSVLFSRVYDLDIDIIINLFYWLYIRLIIYLEWK